ncbi:hypothetical protein RhiirA4_481124 [Rhizophagus irregularis]|uniref:Uncharacterized protein n=1 Tax=Rhizophagus irregularis TaxID=588596 RepID=A0A2I1HJ05_9GLOM|nr:hypothetical protein RhiirA4_481124 [Rhizophagus irregularis]
MSLVEIVLISDNSNDTNANGNIQTSLSNTNKIETYTSMIDNERKQKFRVSTIKGHFMLNHKEEWEIVEQQSLILHFSDGLYVINNHFQLLKMKILLHL